MREGRPPGRHAETEGTRAEVAAAAAEFGAAAGPALRAALRHRLAALFAERRDWREAMPPEVTGALDAASDRAIEQGVSDVERRLRAEELWLSPRVVRVETPPPTPGWDGILPTWLVDVLRRLSRRDSAPALGPLDDTGNRVWVALLSAAKALDPVLEEFGLEPKDVPDPGGGHYGLQPRTEAELDPTGGLGRICRRYRGAYTRYVAAGGAS